MKKQSKHLTTGWFHDIFGLTCCCSVIQLCLTLCDPKDCSTPGFPVLHNLLEFAQTHDHWVSDAIPPSHHLSPSSPSAFNLSQHQGLTPQNHLKNSFNYLDLTDEETETQGVKITCPEAHNKKIRKVRWA